MTEHPSPFTLFGSSEAELHQVQPPTADGRTIHVTMGGIQSAQAEHIQVEQGGIMQARAQDIAISEGGIMIAMAQHTDVTDSSVNLLVAEEISGDNIHANVLLARHVQGDVQTLVTPQIAALFGLTFGIGLALLSWLFKSRAAS